jgi:hypothetical protein
MQTAKREGGKEGEGDIYLWSVDTKIASPETGYLVIVNFMISSMDFTYYNKSLFTFKGNIPNYASSIVFQVKKGTEKEEKRRKGNKDICSQDYGSVSA